MVLYRFGSTGVVQVLSRAAELLGLVPVFPVRNVHSFTSGSASSTAVFRDCVLVKRYIHNFMQSCLAFLLTDCKGVQRSARSTGKSWAIILWLMWRLLVV